MADIRISKTIDALRLRSGPGTNYSTLEVIDKDQTVEYVPITPIQANTYSWVPVYVGRWGWCAIAFIEAYQQTKPSFRRTKIGLHVHSTNAPNAKIIEMAPYLGGVTVLNNAGLANALVSAGVPYVVGRLCLTDHDPMPVITGNDKIDRETGKRWYMENQPNFPIRDYILSLDKRVIVQLVNEQNHDNDSFFYLGAMEAAAKEERKLIIFNDGVGNPWDSDSKNGFGIWRKRINSGCLKRCKELGMFVGYHGYGRPEEYPGSAIGDDEAWKLYGGRVLEAYAITPEDSRPDIIYSECGTFKANYMGIDFTLADMQGYQSRLKDNPYVKSVHYWEAGGRGDKSFNRSCLDPALDAIEAYLKG